MRDDEEFNVMFVLVVEVLYNYKLEKYSNRNLKEVAWQKVASEVKCTAEECKRRWRMLRISLLRHLRENKKPSGNSGKKKKPFYLEDAMKYLIPYTKSRRQTGTVDFDEDEVCENDSQLEDRQTVNNDEESVNASDIPHNNIEDENEESQENNEPCTSDLLESNTVSSVTTDLSGATSLSSKKRKIQENNEPCTAALLESNTSSSVSTDLSKPTSLSSKKRKIQSTQNWENAAVQCLTALSTKYNANTKKKESCDEEDSDLLFLKSLLPDLKKLSDAQKRRFKQGIFVLYDEILNEDSARSTVQVPLPAPYSSAVSVSSYDSNLHYTTENEKQYVDLVNAAVFE